MKSKIERAMLFAMQFIAMFFLFANDVHAEKVDQAPAQCQVRNFQDFFIEFSEKVELQRKFTKVPLVKLTLVDELPEPRPVINELKNEQITFPIIPNLIERNQQGLSVRLSTLDSENAKAVIKKADTGYLITYIFVRFDGCWMLTRVENWSL